MWKGCSHYLIAVFVALIIFGNHYTRDAPGALEKQLESEIGFSPHEYSLLNSMYFIPNIATPLLAGIFIKDLGGIPKAFLLSVLIVSIGHIVFVLGVEAENKFVMYFGKAISGSMYEIIDALMPIIYLTPIYKDEFPLVVGMLQIFLRSGSVVNFVLSPYVYFHYGLKSAFWVAAAMGCTAIPLFLLARYLEVGSLSMDPRLTYRTAVPIDLDDESEGDTPSSKEDTSSTNSSSDAGHHEGLNKLFPPNGYGWPFYLYSSAGACLYGGIVPFWFFGSKYLQDSFALSVSTADQIIAVPEIMVVVVGIPVGFSLSYCQWTIQTKLSLMTGAMLLMAVAYCLLLYLGFHSHTLHDKVVSPSNPVTGVLCAVMLMGAGFSVACNVFWSLIGKMVDEAYLSPATGLISCAVNLLPAVIPPVIAALTVYTQQHSPIIVMTVLVVIGVICSAGAQVSIVTSHRHVQHATPSQVGADKEVNVRDYEMVPVLEPVDEEAVRERHEE